MDVTFATLQDTVLTKHVTYSGGGIELGEKYATF